MCYNTLHYILILKLRQVFSGRININISLNIYVSTIIILFSQNKIPNSIIKIDFNAMNWDFILYNLFFTYLHTRRCLHLSNLNLQDCHAHLHWLCNDVNLLPWHLDYKVDKVVFHQNLKSTIRYLHPSIPN